MSRISTASSEIASYAYAEAQDSQDPLRFLREEFVFPSKQSVSSEEIGNLADPTESQSKHGPSSIYLCGNSLGLQPKRTREYINSYLDTWATKGVNGHFIELKDGKTSPWLSIDEDAKKGMSDIVGALPSEVAMMQTLTGNLHLLMASFYKPTKEKYKIVIEGKAFPSDHYAVLSQLQHHNISSSALITIEPPNPEFPYISTEHICSVITEHASTTALVLLPGIQYYTGQFLDIPTITKHAHSHGLTIGWDLAHAAGNVPLSLHDWDVDFAAWCSYKYLNAGPGSIGGLFVHDKHTQVDATTAGTPKYRPRLSGWWGHDKSSRFAMGPDFLPTAGASGFMLSNPSVFDMTSVVASLSVFNQTSMSALREKSLKLTAYLESLFLQHPSNESSAPLFKIITPSNPNERGAQLSVKFLRAGLLAPVLEVLESKGVVIDERKPDVIRVAPAPLYNSFRDVFAFYEVFVEALEKAVS